MAFTFESGVNPTYFVEPYMVCTCVLFESTLGIVALFS